MLAILRPMLSPHHHRRTSSKDVPVSAQRVPLVVVTIKSFISSFITNSVPLKGLTVKWFLAEKVLDRGPWPCYDSRCMNSTIDNPLETLPHFKVRYRNAQGKIREHEIGQPFDVVMNQGVKVGFVAYSFGRGIRSFRNDRILAMSSTSDKAVA